MADATLDTCSFCGKHKDDVKKLIVSDDVSICSECVTLCQELLESEIVQPEHNNQERPNNPQEIKNFLDQYVVSQQRAKIALSVGIINHYKRINRDQTAPDIQKTNLLLIGNTGCGKTHLARTAARYLNIPFAICDATSITEAGYVGDDVETLIARLYNAANGDVEKTQKGIVFIDEIDKISRKSESASITRDVSGEGVQQALLKLIEGTICRVPVNSNRKHPNGDMVEIDTSNILFIGGGAFVGLDSIVNKRTKGTSMGFNLAGPIDPVSWSDKICADDLVKFGLIPEFVGRFPSVITLDDLTVQDMMHIMTGVKNNLLEQYKWLFQQDGIELEFSSEALECLANNAVFSKMGARGLHSQLEKLLLPHMFSIPDYVDTQEKHVFIDVEAINTSVNF